MNRLILLGSVSWLVACSGDEAGVVAGSIGGLNQRPHTVVVTGATTTPTVVVDVSTQTMSLERYERLVLGLAGCSLERYQIDVSCPGMRTLTKALRSATAWTDQAVVHGELGVRMIGHVAPAVRIKAAEMLAMSPAKIGILAEAAARERNPAVLQAFIRAAAPHGSEPRIAAMLLAAADHVDRDVRMQAIQALATIDQTSQAAIVGAAAKLVALADHDPAPELRQAACERLGRLGDPLALPLFERTTASAADNHYYAACMDGLVAMFHNPPTFSTANEGAYRLFLRRIAEPRNDQQPPWNVMSAFSEDARDGDGKLAAWHQRAPWFDAAAVRAALQSVATDKHASWMARAAAIESMVGLGASKPELEAVRAGCDATSSADKRVLEALASESGPQARR